MTVRKEWIWLGGVVGALGGVEGGEPIIRKYYIRKKFISNIRRNQEEVTFTMRLVPTDTL